MADDMDIIVPIRCPNCDGLNPPDSKRCQFCGQSLVGAKPTAIAPPSGELRSPAAPPTPPTPDFLSRPADARPAAGPIASPFAAAPPPPQQRVEPIPQPQPAPPASPAARGGGALASRLGGQAPAPANDALGGLDNLRSGIAGFSAADLPQTGELNGYVVPPQPVASPFRREEEETRHRDSESAVDWLASLRASSSLPEEAEQAGEAGDSWLNRVRGADSYNPPPTGRSLSQPLDVARPTSAPLNPPPNQLAEVQHGVVEQPNSSQSLPDWFRSLRGEETEPPAPTADSIPPWLAEQPAPAASNLPAWLSGEDESATSAAPAPTRADSDLPPWLQEEATSQPPAAASNLPSWLSGEEVDTAPAPTSNRPAWLSGATPETTTSSSPTWASSPPPAPTPPAHDSNPGLLGEVDAPWLQQLAAQPLPTPPAATQPQRNAADFFPASVPANQADEMAEENDEMPPWLLAEEQDEAATATSQSFVQAEPDPEGDTDEVEEQAVAEPTAGRKKATGLINEEDLPAWLRAQVAEQEQGQVRLPRSASRANTTAPRPEQGEGSGYVPNWLRNLGTSDEDATAAANAATAASDLTATLAPAIPKISRTMTIRSPRTGAAEAFAALVSSPSSATLTSSVLRHEPRGAAGAMRYLTADRLIYLLTLAVIITAYVLGQSSSGGPLGNIAKPNIAPAVSSFYSTIENLPADAPVLVAFDWDADRQAELQPLSYAVLRHLFDRQRRVTTVSLLPAGAAFAQQELQRASKDYNASQQNTGKKIEYLNLGYLPGNEIGLRGLATGPLANALTGRADFQGNPLTGSAALRGVSRLSDYRLIVLLEGDEGLARQWAEQLNAARLQTQQVANASGVNQATQVVIGYSQAAQATVNLYLNGSRPLFSGNIAGLLGTDQYALALNQAGKALDSQLGREQRSNVLSFALILIVLLIIIGNIVLISRWASNRR